MNVRANEAVHLSSDLRILRGLLLRFLLTRSQVSLGVRPSK